MNLTTNLSWSIRSLLVPQCLKLIPTCRRSSHGMRRKPVIAEFTDDEYENLLKTRKSPPPKNVSKSKTSKNIKNSVNNSDDLQHKSKIDEFKTPKFKYDKITSINAEKFTKLMNNMRLKSYQKNHQIGLLTGKNMVRKAIESGCFVRAIYFSKHEQLEDMPQETLVKTNLMHVSSQIMQLYPDILVGGVAAIITRQDAKTRYKLIKQREEQEQKKLLEIVPVTVVCVGIKHPRVLGEVLRVTSATGCKQVYVMENCADVWMNDVIRASNGAHFNIPIVPDLSWDNLDNLSKSTDVVIASQQDISLVDFMSERKAKYREQMKALHSSLVSDLQGVELNTSHIPSISYHKLPLSSDKQQLVMVGKFDENAVMFAMNRLDLGTSCVRATLPTISDNDDLLSPAIQASVLLVETRRRILEMRTAASNKPDSNNTLHESLINEV